MSLIDSLVGLYAPHRCLSCGIDNRLACTSCVAAELIPYPQVCFRCNKLSEGFKTCLPCRSSTSLGRVFVGYEYEGLALELVRALKFNRARAGAKLIAAELEQCLPEVSWDVVTNIPTSPKRVRRRGYDQAKQIAKEVGVALRIPDQSLLWRLTNTRQVGSHIDLRRKQAQEAFSVRMDVQGKHVLIIDDVMASGATMEAAAAVLKKSGAKRIDAAVFARS